MKPDVTVVTASIPDRHDMLLECMESVRRQTYKVAEHRIGIDTRGEGQKACCHIRNDLGSTARTRFLIFLDDDDLLLPDHVESLVSSWDDGYGMIYSFCDRWKQAYDPGKLKRGNYIPVCAGMMEVSAFKEVKGYPDDPGMADHKVWLQLQERNPNFGCVERVTYVIRPKGDRSIRPYWESEKSETS